MKSKENTSSEVPVPNETTQIPTWVKPEYFENIAVEEIEDFSKITSFKAEPGSAPGENYASVMLRIQMEVELKDGSKKEISLMMKTENPAGSLGAEIAQMAGAFDKESEVYEKIIPAFEKLYLEKGKKVKFGPKYYKLAKDPGEKTVVLEDLKPRQFKNANRFEGLDLDHTKSVLKILAEYHAASAVYYETIGSFPEKFNHGIFERSHKEVFTQMYTPMLGIIKDSCKKYVNNGKHFCEVMVSVFGSMYITKISGLFSSSAAILMLRWKGTSHWATLIRKNSMFSITEIVGVTI